MRSDRVAARGARRVQLLWGGRRIAIRRPRVRSIDGELGLPSYEAAADRDPLNRHRLEAVAAGVSTRRYARSLDRLPPAETERSTSKSAVSRRFVAWTEQKLGEWLSRPLDPLDLKVVMLAGIHFRDSCILVALGVDSDGKKRPTLAPDPNRCVPPLTRSHDRPIHLIVPTPWCRERRAGNIRRPRAGVDSLEHRRVSPMRTKGLYARIPIRAHANSLTILSASPTRISPDMSLGKRRSRRAASL